jgi:hypothetical protein
MIGVLREISTNEWRASQKPNGHAVAKGADCIKCWQAIDFGD